VTHTAVVARSLPAKNGEQRDRIVVADDSVCYEPWSFFPVGLSVVLSCRKYDHTGRKSTPT